MQKDISSEKGGEINLFSILSIIIIIAVSTIPFIKNYKYNDNHLNWLNHDYGKNLMISTEENSILMTEGGDNQVFSTLYFTYAAKLRPDITPYDQKGNIFKRIYGDLRYTGQFINRRWQLVDTAIFDGQEPFYKEIRNPANPYFVPYWQGKRPVYMTWMKTHDQIPHNLYPGVYGDVYYKRYGIMYKVQDIEYRLVDFLELKKNISITEAMNKFKEWLPNPDQNTGRFVRDAVISTVSLPEYSYMTNLARGIDGQVDFNKLLNLMITPSAKRYSKWLPNSLLRDVNMDYTMKKLQKLVSAGYIKIAGDRIQFVKMYPNPLEKDILESYLLRWREVPNAKYWDFLTREIVVNYAFTMGDIHQRKVNELIEIRGKEKRPEIIAEINKRIKLNKEKVNEYYEEVLTYGHNSISTHHNVAVKYMHSGDPVLKKRSYTILTNGLRMYPGSFGTYGLLIQQLVRDMLEHPENEKKNIKELDSWYVKIKKNLEKSGDSCEKDASGKRKKNGTFSYKNHSAWAQLGGLEMYYKQFVQMPGAQLAQMKTMVDTQIADPKAVINENLALNTLVYLYQRGATIQYAPLVNDFFNLYEKLIPRMKTSYMFNIQLYQFSWQNLRRTQGIERLKLANGLLNLAENLASIGLQKEHVEFYFSFGEIASLLGKDNAALGYYKKFIAEMDKDSVAQIRNSKVIAASVDKIKALEAKLKKVKY